MSSKIGHGTVRIRACWKSNNTTGELIVMESCNCCKAVEYRIIQLLMVKLGSVHSRLNDSIIAPSIPKQQRVDKYLIKK